MASLITHSVVAYSFGKLFFTQQLTSRLIFVSIICSCLPDADVITFFFGLEYGNMFGHRGFFHSFTFAFILGFVVTMFAFPDVKPFVLQWWKICLFLFFLTATHPILDAMTNGGLGIALFAPFDNTRYFLPWRPLIVAPIGIIGFFSEWGMRVLISEIIWIWLPLFLLTVSIVFYRRVRT